MTTADNIRFEIKQRTDRIAEAKRSIGNLTHHIGIFKSQVATHESELIALRADLLKLEPIKEVVL